ncbi:MAG: sulfite oxidase [Oceanospirillaceae bacterium]|nr:sulfite oxidase [Oceanospirillaceae bacterium]
MNNKKIGIRALYQQDPERADWELFGRRPIPRTRRGFISGLGRMSALLGGTIVFHRFMPSGLIPAALAETAAPFEIPGKDGLTVLNDRPLNAETPAHLLNDDITPAERLFIRNNGLAPTDIDLATWTLDIGGESVKSAKTYTLDDLKERFTAVDLQLTLECGGNGRAGFYPPASGNQWTYGAVGCPQWNGIRLRDVLEDCGIADDAVYIGYYGADSHLSGDPNKVTISRGVPIAKALEDESMIAWGLNGQPLPLENGYPLRLVIGGWPGSTSGKWLNRIVIRNQVHDGPKMTGHSYRVPCEPVAPGTDVPEEGMCIIESMPVKSLITSPRSGVQHALAEKLKLHGHAWAGDRAVKELHISIDFGETWQTASLQAAANRLAWQNWDHEVTFPQPGYYEVWARAVDDQGVSQPMVIPGWNPRGYLNNSAHRIAVIVA